MPSSKIAVACLGLAAWIPFAARAQLVVDNPSSSYVLSPTDTPPAPYQGILGSAVFLSTSVDSLNSLQLLGSGYLVLEQPSGPKPAPAYPITSAVIYKSGVQIASAPISYGAPEWRTTESAVPGVLTYILLVPFNFICSRSYAPAVVTAGSYRLNLTDGTNAFSFVEFALAPAPPLPKLDIQVVGKATVVSWRDPGASGLVALQESADFQRWSTVAFSTRASGSITNSVGAGQRFYRLRSGL